MTPTSRASLKDELSNLLNAGTKPKDFDPEALNRSDDEDTSDAGQGVGEGSDTEAEDRGRGHYVAVGKSKLRARIQQQQGPEALGVKYVGKKVKRGDLYGRGDADDSDNNGEKEGGDEGGDEDDEDEVGDGAGLQFEMLEGMVGEEGSGEEIDSDAAFSKSDEEKEWAKFKFKGSKTTKGGGSPKKRAKIAGSSSEGEEDEEDGGARLNELGDSNSDAGSGDDEEDEESTKDGEDSEPDSSSGSDSDAAHAELRKAFAGSTAATPITANTDVEKGAAIRAQQATFDGFLGGRVKLQRALIAVNDLALLEEDGKINASLAQDSWKEAEEVAVKLWNTIAEMRTVWSPLSPP